MKRIYNYIKNLIVTRYKLMRFTTFLLFLTSIISVFYHHINVTAGAFFAGSLISLIYMWTYKNGPIIILGSDDIWSFIIIKNRKKMSRDEMEEIYEKKALKVATVSYIIAVAGLFLWIHVELLVFLSSLM